MKNVSITKQTILTKATNVLCAFYAKHKNRGILAIYLWGSITTGDFDAKKSDIDSIAFVEEQMSIANEPKAIKALSKQLPGLSMRFVYLGEMKGGKPKGNLAKIADYRLLAVDLPYWQHIVGQKITLPSLGLKLIIKNDVIRLTLRQIYNRNLKEIRNQQDKEKYFVKAMMRLCFYIQQRGKQSGPFSYSRVKKTANRVTQSVVNALFEIKQNEYDRKILDKHLPALLIFLKTYKKKYG